MVPLRLYTLRLIAFTDCIFKAQILGLLPFFYCYLFLVSLLPPPSSYLSDFPAKRAHILGSLLITGFPRQSIHTAPYTHTATQRTPWEERLGSKCLMLWFQGDCDCRPRQKQMLLFHSLLFPSDSIRLFIPKYAEEERHNNWQAQFTRHLSD